MGRLDGDVPVSAIPTRAEPHAEYRQRARRIRSVFRARPGARLRALRELAESADASRVEAAAPVMENPIVPLPAGAAQTFAALVRERMDGPVLRYSHRTRLLRAAEQTGIGRFEANLIIAAVQHEARANSSTSTAREAGHAWIPAALLAVAATQSLIAMGVWWVVG